MTGRDIPEEMVERVERAWPSVWFDHTDWRTKIRALLSAALAGRTVLELPEPDENDDEDDPPMWHVDGIDGAVEAHPDTAEVDFAYWTWPHGTARAFAAALLAAADVAAAGSGSGED